MIKGVGTDLVKIGRIRRNMNTHGSRFLRRVFTETEIEYCNEKADPAQHFSGRFAAKEAIMKVLGSGRAEGVSWTDIEIQSRDSGEPVVQLLDVARQKAKQRGIDEVLVSISHTDDQAMAFAVGQ